MKQTMHFTVVMAAMLLLVAVAEAETFTNLGNGVFEAEQVVSKLDLKTGDRLMITSATMLGGNITIATTDAQPKLMYKKRLKVDDLVQARQFASEISVEIDKSPEKITIALRAPATASWSGTDHSGRINVRIEIPEGCHIEVSTAYFDLIAEGPFSSFTTSETLAAVEVSKVVGSTEIRVSNRELKLTDISGMLTANNKYGSIKLEKINTGDQTALIRNENGEILITGFTGTIDARTSYNRIVAKEITLTGDRNRFRNVSSPIEIQLDSLTSGDLLINNRYDDIDLVISDKVDAVFICKTGQGAVANASGMTIVPTLVYDNRLEFMTGEGEAEVRITARDAGNINIFGPEANKSNLGGR